MRLAIFLVDIRISSISSDFFNNRVFFGCPMTKENSIIRTYILPKNPFKSQIWHRLEIMVYCKKKGIRANSLHIETLEILNTNYVSAQKKGMEGQK